MDLGIGIAEALAYAVAYMLALSLPLWPPIIFVMYWYATARRQFSLLSIVVLVTIEAVALAVFAEALRRFQEFP